MNRVLAMFCTVAALAAPVTAQPPAPSGLEVTGATFAELDDAAGLWTLRGAPVVVRRGAMTLRAPSITYDARRQIVHATGGVQYDDEALMLTADEATAWITEDRLVADGHVVAVQRGADPVRLRAARVEGFARERRLIATGGPSVTSPDGTIEGERIEADGQRDEVVAAGNARIVSGDIDGRAPRAVLRRRDGLAVLSGGAVVRQAGHEALAQTITVDLRRRRITASGAARVTIQTGR